LLFAAHTALNKYIHWQTLTTVSLSDAWTPDVELSRYINRHGLTMIIQDVDRSMLAWPTD